MDEAEQRVRDAILERGDVSRETLVTLEALTAHMADWQTRMNLMGPKEFGRIWSRHIEDSLQLLPHLSQGATVLDLGSGGGFPGLVLAAATEPPGHVTLVESVGKKCAFLSNAIDTLGLLATVIHGRIETLKPFQADYVTARALAPLPKLIEYAAPWFQTGAIGLFHKGKSWQEEMESANRQWAFHHEVFTSRTDPAAVILKLSEVRPHG